jgi:hypothetical protein
VPFIEQLEQTQYPIKIPTSGLGQLVLIPKEVFVQQTATTFLHVNIPITTILPVYGNRIPF